MILHKYLSPVSPHQTAIAPQHQTPDRLFPKHQTAIAPQHPQTRSPIPQINQRSPLITQKTDRLFPHIKQRSPLNTQNPIAYSHTSNSDRPSSPTKSDRLNLNVKQQCYPKKLKVVVRFKYLKIVVNCRLKCLWLIVHVVS